MVIRYIILYNLILTGMHILLSIPVRLGIAILGNAILIILLKRDKLI